MMKSTKKELDIIKNIDRSISEYINLYSRDSELYILCKEFQCNFKYRVNQMLEE